MLKISQNFRNMNIVIIRETKNPIDRRTPLTPEQLKQLQVSYPQHRFYIQSSSIRCFSDGEYKKAGVQVIDNISDCDILLGVKEVSISTIEPRKIYMFFSHTAKKQPFNQKLLQALSSKGATLIDYEYLLNEKKVRVVAFGFWAGLVGAYNGLRAYGLKYNIYDLLPPEKCKNIEELHLQLKKVSFEKPLRIVITGEGRVASGALSILQKVPLKQVNPLDFLRKSENLVYTQIGPQHYTVHKNGIDFSFHDFVTNPHDYISSFEPYCKKSTIMLACHFWDNRSPHFFNKDDLVKNDFNLEIIADISCDLDGPIPTTIRASTLEEPFYGVSKQSGKEDQPFKEDVVTVMAVDNLPGAIPRESSKDFGENLTKHVLPFLFEDKYDERILNDATILRNGELTRKFGYLKGYLQGV